MNAEGIHPLCVSKSHAPTTACPDCKHAISKWSSKVRQQKWCDSSPNEPNQTNPNEFECVNLSLRTVENWIIFDR